MWFDAGIRMVSWFIRFEGVGGEHVGMRCAGWWDNGWEFLMGICGTLQSGVILGIRWYGCRRNSVTGVEISYDRFPAT